MIKYYEEIGEIDIRPNPKAKSIVVRYRDGIFRLTYPIGLRQKDIDLAILRLRKRLIAMKENAPKSHQFMPSNDFQTFSFTARIIEKEKTQFSLIFKEGILYIVCPSGSDYTDQNLQERIKNAITLVMRNEAKRLFPDWIRGLAKKNGFEVASVKINNSRSRWGSCSSQKNISLSLYCMLLPQHLIELVMLHELCHTVEMNHSERFWSLLDKVTNGRSKELTAELKKFKTNF